MSDMARRLPFHIESVIAIALFPLIRTTAMPPLPAGVDMAQIVSDESYSCVGFILGFLSFTAVEVVVFGLLFYFILYFVGQTA